MHKNLQKLYMHAHHNILKGWLRKKRSYYKIFAESMSYRGQTIHPFLNPTTLELQF